MVYLRPIHIVPQSPRNAHVNADLFDGLTDGFLAGRYHSWVIDPESFPKVLEVTARDANGHIMALRHRTFEYSWSAVSSGKRTDAGWRADHAELAWNACISGIRNGGREINILQCMF